MSQCQNGSTSIHVLAICVYQGSLGNLATSTTTLVVLIATSLGHHYTVEGVKKVVEFQYPEIVHNHYKFCDMIDNHNSFGMHPISIKETWMTMRWVFCFSSCHHHCQHTKCSCVFPQQAKIGCFAILTTNCKAIHIQSLFAGRRTGQEVSEMGFY